MNIEEFYEKAKAIAGDKLINVTHSMGERYGYDWCVHIIENDRIVNTAGANTPEAALNEFSDAVAQEKLELHSKLDEARAKVARLEAEIAAQTK